MKKKKLLLITSLLLMFALVFVGCGTESTNTEPAPQGDTGQTTEDQVDDGEEQDEGEEHSHGAYEWMGEFEFTAGTYLFHFGESADETMDVGFIKLGENITDLEHHAEHLMVADKEDIAQDSTFEAKSDYAYTFEMNEDHGHIHFTIAEDGTYAIATEHLPEESTMQIFDEDENEILPIKEYEGSGHSH